MTCKIIKRKFLMMLLSVLSLGTSGLYAHHSHSMFDADAELTLAGKVVGLRYANPHIRMLLEVVNESGQMEKWDIEMSTIANMRGRGVTREVLAVGNEIVITVNPLRDGGLGGNYDRIHSVNGVMNMADGSNWSPES
jgi:hypothetical protein